MTQNSMLPIGGLLLAGLTAGALPSLHREPAQVSAKLSEWTIQLSETTVPAGPVDFTITNTGSIPHGFEVEGHGIEKETALIKPGEKTTLTLTLKAGDYEIYCPVGEDSHKKLGMDTHLRRREVPARPPPALRSRSKPDAPASAVEPIAGDRRRPRHPDSSRPVSVPGQRGSHSPVVR